VFVQKGLDSDTNETISARSNYERDRIQQARRIMKPFFLRRLKRDVLRDLPPKTEEVHRVALHPEQKKIYDEALQDIRRKVADAKAAGSTVTGGGASIMMQLRKMANHPLLWRHKYDDQQLMQLTKLLLKEPINANSAYDVVLEELKLMSDFQIHTTLGLYPVRFAMATATSTLLN
jgi:SWI/SNF-related matrix-associated actin-dependent regulator 1 of chromatin subfamily A